jgi:ABC-type bacteriocin/lantibiotic exporter with double-glycine peptidase domain
VRDVASNAAAKTPKLEGSLELRNIQFGYNRADVPLIERIHLYVKPGSASRSSVPPAAASPPFRSSSQGYMKPWQGEVLFDGRVRAHYSRYALANSLCLVDQDIVMFEGTFRENLTCGTTPSKKRI